jgi:hypothetical protein
MCRGCSSNNNQMNMIFQVLGAGMISLSVVAGVACVFRVGLMIWMAAVAVDSDSDSDSGNSNNKQ